MTSTRTLIGTTNANTIIREIDGTFEEVKVFALELGADTVREVLPVRLYRQGPRLMVDAVLPIKLLIRILDHHSATKGSTATKAVQSSNRPVDSAHVAGIAKYLLDSINADEPWLLPPLTLNARAGVEIYVPKGMSGTITGWAVLPEERRIYITDGQHRYLAIHKVVDTLAGTDKGARFMSDSISAMITLSEDMEQVHQDFADASKTKPLPKSLVAVYDIRHPGNRAVMKLVEKVSLFRDRIDATSSTMSINSPYVFLVNQVRQFVKASLTGKAVISDDAFYQQSHDALQDPVAFETWVDSRAVFLDVLTEMIPEWLEIATLPRPQGPEGHVVLTRMKEIRARQPVSMSAALLVALGLLSYRDPLMQSSKAPDRLSLRQRLAPLGKVDWNRTDAFWQGNLVEGGLIRSQTTPIKDTADKLEAVITGALQL